MSVTTPKPAEAARTKTVAALPRSEAEQRLRELERFAELGRLSASLLHEISNPLTAALLYLEQYDEHNDPQATHIRQVRRNILLLQRYVEAARQQVRQESAVSSFYVRRHIDQVKQVLLPLARRRGIRLQIGPAANYKLYGDPVKFQQIMANLIANAIDAYAGDGHPASKKEVIVKLSSRRQWLYIKVQDRGSGIKADHLPRIFDPFYSTKHCRDQGLGIGLAVVKQHVEHGFYGAVSATSSPHQGTEFIAKLRLTPAYQKQKSA